MSNSILSNDTKLKSIEVTDYLKIPTANGMDFKKNLGREGELKYNTTENCLMVKTSKSWTKLSLKPYEQLSALPSAPPMDLPPPYADDVEKKTMIVST